MKVSDLMSRDLKIVSPDQSIREAARMMMDSDVGALPVGSEERVEGMITDRDIAVRAVAQGCGPDTPVREAMSRGDLVVCYADQDLDDAAAMMSDNQVRRLPVLDGPNGRLVGMLSLGDLARAEDTSMAEEALSGASEAGGQHNQSQEGARGTSM